MMNRQILLASRPQGPLIEANFRLVEQSIPEPADGEVLIRNEWLSLDPYMRGRMNDVKSYVPPAELGAVMVGQTVGEVLQSRHPQFQPGMKVLTPLGWQLHGAVKGSDLTTIDTISVPGPYHLVILGMP